MPFYYSGPGQKVNAFDTGRRGNRMQISCTLMAISITLFLKWYKNWKSTKGDQYPVSSFQNQNEPRGV
jgi:hypothetical protein